MRTPILNRGAARTPTTESKQEPSVEKASAHATSSRNISAIKFTLVSVGENPSTTVAKAEVLPRFQGLVVPLYVVAKL